MGHYRAYTARMVFSEYFRKLLPLGIVFLPIALLGIFSYSILHFGTPEFRLDKTQAGFRVEKILRPLNPVQTGDIIVRIRGLSYNEVLSSLIFQADPPASGDFITIKRGDQLFELKPEFNPVHLSQFLLSASPQLILFLIMISLGILTFYHAKGDQPVLIFLIMLCAFSSLFSASLPSHFGILNPHISSLSFFVLTLGNWIAFGSFLHFVFSFPKDRNMVRQKPALIPVLYLIAPAISLFFLFFTVDHPEEYLSELQRIRNLGLPVIAVMVFAKHVIDYTKVRSSLEKNQIKLIISAYWMSFGPYIFLYLMPNILFTRPLISFRMVALFGLLLPMAYYIAMIRYRLMDVDRIISKTIAYVFLIFILAICHSYLIVRIKHVSSDQNAFSEGGLLVGLILTAVLFGPASRLISSALDRLFRPEPFYHKTRLPDLAREIGSSLNLKDLAGLLTQMIPREFGITRLLMAVFENRDVRLFPEEWGSPAPVFDYTLIKAELSGGKDYFFPSLQENSPEKEKLKAALMAESIELVFALRGTTTISGLIFLGSREDGRPYTGKDLEFFLTLASQTGLALENAYHYESLMKSNQELERMFAKVAQSEKMAALGEMSTILAHELKNPLGIIRSSAQYLIRDSHDSETQKELLEYILGEVDGLKRIIDNMMGLARYKSPELEKIDLNREIGLLRDRFAASQNHNPLIDIEIVSKTDLCGIIADLKQLQQVFLNLITNSEDAMPKGGKITIRIEQGPSGNIEVIVADTGPGIPEENLEKAFIKFFTTKEKGMGIGLCICKQIVLAHNGHITLMNGEKGGLEARISLPKSPVPTMRMDDFRKYSQKEYHRA